MMLFFLLATDILVTYRLRLAPPRGRSRVHETRTSSRSRSSMTIDRRRRRRSSSPRSASWWSRSRGVLNLGVEGMMLIGAVTGFAVDLASTGARARSASSRRMLAAAAARR